MTTQKPVASLTEKDVMSVYSGWDGKCCCGCSGKHTTNPLYQALRSEERGYQVDEDECDARTVKTILNKIKRNVAIAEIDNGCVAVVIGKRLYVAYLVPSDEKIEAARKRRAENKIKYEEAKVAAFQGAGI